jgi:hypothetical protein
VARRKSYALARQAPDEAAADAELMDYDFHLFAERSTGEDSVIYRTADGYRLALAHARNELPGTVDPSITVSKMPAPRLSVTEAAARLEAAGQSFLFFVNAGTGQLTAVTAPRPSRIRPAASRLPLATAHEGRRLLAGQQPAASGRRTPRPRTAGPASTRGRP